MAEIDTLRKLMQKHMAAENYETARQYLYLIEHLSERGEDDDEDEMPMMAD